jgi:hypothetical protein
MHTSNDWTPPKPVAFAWLLCVLMLGGEIVSGASQNPMAIAFYSFLPAALWMISQERKRDAEKISELKARVDQLEEARSAAALSKAG